MFRKARATDSRSSSQKRLGTPGQFPCLIDTIRQKTAVLKRTEFYFVPLFTQMKRESVIGTQKQGGSDRFNCPWKRRDETGQKITGRDGSTSEGAGASDRTGVRSWQQIERATVGSGNGECDGISLEEGTQIS